MLAFASLDYVDCRLVWVLYGSTLADMFLYRRHPEPCAGMEQNQKASWDSNRGNQ